ncbi:hypothetical protein ACIPL1_27455 [Pseudomonas sp. NPDC090202]|uniref:hypothetical protein n=1 Tax=Pseudomonas sp. NPDC090202 TaxID=3364476 RepID=UPI003808FC6D
MKTSGTLVIEGFEDVQLQVSNFEWPSSDATDRIVDDLKLPRECTFTIKPKSKKSHLKLMRALGVVLPMEANPRRNKLADRWGRRK